MTRLLHVFRSPWLRPKKHFLTKMNRVNNLDSMIAYASSIPESVLQELSSKPYDNLWMSKYNIDQAVLATFTSKMKLENLCRYRAVRSRDQLFIQCS